MTAEAYRRYGPALVRKAARMLGDREEARDVVHGLFTDLLAKGSASPELPYLYQAVTRRCLNRLRDQKTRARLLAAEGAAVTDRTSFEGRVLSRDLLLKLVGTLDAATAETLVYRYLDDLTQEEVAELMRTSRKTVGRRLERARSAAEALSGGGS